MRAPYEWQCFACSTTNAAAAEICSTCGFPAQATGADIAAVRAASAAGTSPPPLSGDKPAIESIAEVLSPLPFWRQFLAVCGGASLFGGVLWFKIAASFPGLAWSAIAVLAGITIMALALAGHDSSTSTTEGASRREADD